MNSNLPATIATTTTTDAITLAMMSKADRLSELATSAQRVVDDVRAARSASTVRAYNGHWSACSQWLAGKGIEWDYSAQDAPAISADVLAVYVDHLYHVESKSPATIMARVAALSAWHRDRSLQSPADHQGVRLQLTGIRNQHMHSVQHGQRPDVQRAAAATWDAVSRMVAAVDNSASPDLVKLRDRALLLVGFASGCRRSELAAMRFGMLTIDNQGIIYNIVASKTKKPRKAVITPNLDNPSLCPVLAYNAYVRAAGISDGYVFRGVAITPHGAVALRPSITGQQIARTVQRHAITAGVPDGKWSGHSLRRGYVVQGLRDGVSTEVMRHQTGHSVSGISPYTADADPFATPRNLYGRSRY
jgi:integrase